MKQKKGFDFMLKERIRQLRKDRAWTQKYLGEQLGISASTVGMYEQGRREPDHKTTLAYCDIFGVTADYLLKEEENTVKEIGDFMSRIKTNLLSQQGLMFNGKPLSEEDLKKIADTVELSIKVLALDEE